MKKALNIKATLYDPTLLKNLVEKLASQHVDKGYNQALVPQQWQPLETSCTMAYVMGNFDLGSKPEQQAAELSMPFTSLFLFTCIKEKYGLFQLEWSASLS